jgi:hypothetical protein
MNKQGYYGKEANDMIVISCKAVNIQKGCKDIEHTSCGYRCRNKGIVNKSNKFASEGDRVLKDCCGVFYDK